MSVALLWGVGLRLLAVVYLLAFYSLYQDLPGLAGPRGIFPVADLLAGMRRDYGWRRVLYAPSLLHLASSWHAQQAFLALGAASAALALLGAPGSSLCFLIAWVVFLSFDVAVDLIYPWDALLLEAGFLAVLAPPLLPLPAIAAAAAPHPVLGFALRFLAFRVVLGFGKFKFFGPGRLASGYLKQFLVTQPLPRPLGLLATRLPLWMHQAALAALFVVEVLLPWLWLGPAPYRVVPSLAVGGLMLALQCTGNFGYFNVAMLPLLILAAAPQASAFDLLSGGVPFTLDAAHLAGLALLSLGLIHFPFNSWVARSFMYWPALLRVGRGVLRPLLAVTRALAPFRLVHAYGVFSPLSGPSLKWVPVFEASRDGVSFEPYRYRYYPTDARFPGVRVAPLCPRFDHSITYEAMGLGLGNLFGCVVGGGRPHRASRALYFERVQRRLLEASPDVLALFAHAPHGAARPALVRVRFQVHIWDGERFAAHPVGDHLPATTLAHSEPLELPAPEAFLFDDRIWTERALGALDPRAELQSRDAQLLFTFLTDIGAEAQLRAVGAGATSDAILDLARTHRDALRVHERAAFRLAWLLRTRSEPLAGEGELELGLRCLRIALSGERALASALANPCGALSAYSLDEALCAFALLRPSWVQFHARKAALRAVTLRGSAGKVPSFAPGILRINGRLAELFPDPTLTLPVFAEDRARGFVIAHTPPSPPVFPLTQGLRNAFRPKRDRARMAMEISALGDAVRLPFPGKQIYFLTHPRDLKHVLSTHAENYRKSFDYGILASLLGSQGLVTTEGEVWQNDRKQIQPLFKKEMIDSFSVSVTRCVDQLVQRWRARDESSPLDITAEMMRLTMTVIGHRVLSQDISADADRLSRLISACQTNVIDRSTMPLDLAKYVRTPSRRRFERNRAEILSILDRYIDRRLGNPELSGSRDLLTQLAGQDRLRTRDHVMTFFAAGHETTATALSWMFYLLGRHPDVQERVSVDSIPDGARFPKYARAVIDESMRLYPPIPVVGREALADDELSGYPISKGSTLVLFLYATHRRPDLWERPEEFRPERFLESERARQTPFSFLPFSAGPRVCIGAQFAMMEMQLALATLTREFRFAATPGAEVCPIPLISLRPHTPILMQVTRRH